MEEEVGDVSTSSGEDHTEVVRLAEVCSGSGGDSFGRLDRGNCGEGGRDSRGRCRVSEGGK